MVHFGSYAMNVMRIEKAYKAWGSELTTEITPIEARLERFIDLDRPFIGRDATVARRDQAEPLSMVLVYCEVDATDNDVRGNEPAFDADGNVMGIATSGAWAHTVGPQPGLRVRRPRVRGARLDVRARPAGRAPHRHRAGRARLRPGQLGPPRMTRPILERRRRP